MATRKIKDAKDISTNELIYFKGHAKATYMSDGTTVEDAINNIEVGTGVDLSDYATKEELSSKQDKLLSGTNIKTINGESILGEGNITIESGSEQVQPDWNEIDTTSPAYIANKPDITFDINLLIRSKTGIVLQHDDGCQTYSKVFCTEELRIGDSSIFYYNNELHIYDDFGNSFITFVNNGDGTKFLSDDGTYKEIPTGSTGSSSYSLVNHGTSDTTFTLTPNTFHVWDEVASLTLTLGSETSGVANEYLFQFTSGATATTLSLPSDIKWANDSAPIIGSNMIYQISILKGLASYLEFSNASNTIFFYIEALEYQADKGSTWETWISSEYNTDGWQQYEGMVIDANYLNIVSVENTPVVLNDEIIEGYNYNTVS